MSTPTAKMALAGVLEDLSGENFEKFCYQLLDRRQDPRVKRSKVENKSRLQITDVMVSHFTEDGALRVAVEILDQIGCSEEAQPLKTRAGGQSNDDGGQPSEPGPSDGGAGGGGKMADGKHFVDKHRRDLIQRVNNISSILDELYDMGVITQEVYNTIRAQSIPQEKMRELLGSLNSERSKNIFYKILSVNEKYLMEELHAKK